jgi:bifunctional UDP-N-acetylglucosamine pyrophosphorylase/glucosamine-1-phosphate N-acetyltransferase
MAVADGVPIHVSQPRDVVEAAGVNNRLQLASMERALQRQAADRLMLAGVTLRDPARFDLRGTLKHGTDVEIDINVVIEGDVVLGDHVHVGANSVLRDVTLGNHVRVLENCVLEQAWVGDECQIGPFARLRPGANLTGAAHVGNFVEIKKSVVGRGSKINHLSYIGDSIIGADVNVGAGTITCNYDGAAKHETRIGDRAFIGSNTALVAPVSIGAGATIGAGSVITRDAGDDRLTLTRAKQVSMNWRRPAKKPS